MPSPTLRSTIIAPEGYTFLSLDAIQVELKVLAILSQDPAMLEDLKSVDLHLATAIRMFGFTEDEAEMKSRRYKAKQANFAMAYGADEFKLAEMLECSEEEALEFMAEHKRAYPVFYQWKDTLVAKAKEDGFVVNMFGRIRPLPDLYGGSWKIREKAEREVVNTLCQGTAIDICKLMALYLRRVLDTRVRFILQVHDEWLLECPNDLLQQSLELCKELEQAFPDYPCSLSIGIRYSELKEVSGEV